MTKKAREDFVELYKLATKKKKVLTVKDFVEEEKSKLKTLKLII